MRILYVAMTDDYGDPARGLSFEHTNFYAALTGMGHEVAQFDFMRRKAAVGKRRMNAELISFAEDAKPDVSFFVLFTDEIAPRTLEEIARRTAAPTINWFADDHWRFENFTRHYAPSLTWSVTTDADSIEKYRAIGCNNVIRSQWACNRYAYSKVTDELDHDVTFVGQPHGDRREVIERLRAAGHKVECWGFGWPAGRVNHEEMVRIFSSSRINLNLSNSSEPDMRLRARIYRLVKRIDEGGPRPSQIKGRTFEVPGSGGFLLTDRVPHLQDYFELDKEIAVFDSTEDLLERVGWWLAHPDERAAVAEAGYRRVLAEHTYDHRFQEIFAAAGLQPASELEAAPAGIDSESERSAPRVSGS
jgi:spore maturation protein CgeB